MFIILNKDKLETKDIIFYKKKNKYRICYLLNDIKLLGIPLNIKDFEFIKTYNHVVIKLLKQKDIELINEIYLHINKYMNYRINHIFQSNNTMIIKHYGDKSNIYQKNEINISIDNISIKNNCYFINIFLLE
jgi:hypothetical protein